MPPARPPLAPNSNSITTTAAETESVQEVESNAAEPVSSAGTDTGTSQNSDPSSELAVVLWDEVQPADGPGTPKTQDGPAKPNAIKDLH